MDTDGMQFENPIDNLTYLYDDDNKNQLLRVFDSTANPQGFSDDSDGISDAEDDYKYDDNGNMISDTNKAITHISYNHLNLPVEIIFGTYGKIAYLYNATGNKLKKTVTEGTTITTTDYLTGFQYKNSKLQFFSHAEGYVNATEEMVLMGGTSYRFNYVFNYTDHLGNIRLSYSLDPSTKVLKIIEENHYYPFGLKHSGYNSDKMMYTKEAEVLKIKPVPPLFITSYKYKYNGKEYQDELGLNMYDFGFRNYDPALGRWMNVDPLAERRCELTMYNYVQNSPLFRFDPNGLTDFTLNKKTGEVKQVGEANDEPDRILKTNRKGEVKKNKKGEAKVAIGDIAKNILKVGQNFKSESNVIETGAEGQPSVTDVEKFVLQLSEYVNKEIAGTYISNDKSKDVTHMTIGKYDTNDRDMARNIGHEALRELSDYKNNFMNYEVKGHFHTHPNIESRFVPGEQDLRYKKAFQEMHPNAYFIIITYPSIGESYPHITNYTKF